MTPSDLAAAPSEAPAQHEPGHVPDVPQTAYERLYFVLATLFVALLILTNVVGTKLFALSVDAPLIGPVLSFVDGILQRLLDQAPQSELTLTAGLITYPFTFLITDIVSEVWGRKRADVMVMLGFGASLLMLVVVQIARALPPSKVWSVPEAFAGVVAPEHQVALDGGGVIGDHVAAQAAYQFTFDAPGVLLFASMTAYLVAQLIDNRLFHFWRRLTKGRALWFRNNMSTGLSQFVDTAIVNGIFLHFYWKMDPAAIVGVILSVYVVKFVLALLDTPLCYLGVAVFSRWAGPPPRGT